MAEPVGFIGLGLMGAPMAANLLRAGTGLTVWNRTRTRCEPLVELGARVARTPAEVLRDCPTTILMLIDEAATDAVLHRGSSRFAESVAGRTIVSMGTFRPEYSRALADEVAAAGGAYVEAPVSGSRGPAERGELVAMLSGPDEALGPVEELLLPMCRAVVRCGPIPAALDTKLAVNLYMIVLVSGLVEAYDFAASRGVDAHALARVLEAGPMDNALARTKLDKLVREDFTPQAAVRDVEKNARFVREAADAAGSPAPLITLAHELYAESVRAGHGAEDMVALARVLAARHGSPRP